jgi:hypothetical protein
MNDSRIISDHWLCGGGWNANRLSRSPQQPGVALAFAGGDEVEFGERGG